MAVRELILREDVNFNTDGIFTTRPIKKHAVAVYLVTYSKPITEL